MSEAKRDLRPEGSVLYQSKMAGLWQEVCQLAAFAQVAGHKVEIDASVPKHGYPMAHYFIRVGA